MNRNLFGYHCATCGEPAEYLIGVGYRHAGRGIYHQRCDRCGWTGGRHPAYQRCPRCQAVAALRDDHCVQPVPNVTPTPRFRGTIPA